MLLGETLALRVFGENKQIFAYKEKLFIALYRKTDDISADAMEFVKDCRNSAGWKKNENNITMIFRWT